MIKRLTLGAATAVAASLLSIVPALAYANGAGATVGTTSGTSSPGGTVGFTATFTSPTGGAPIVGEAVTFGFTGGGTGCTVTFTPATGTTDASGSASAVAKFGASCVGAVTLTAVDAYATTITTAVRLPGGLPNASGSPATSAPVNPILPIALLLVGMAIVAGSGAGFILGRRKR